MNLFNRETLTFSHFYNDPEDPDSLSSNQVFALEEDRRGRLWVGTAGGGLCRYEREGKFTTLDERNSALIHNRIRALFCDEDGILWIGTEKGLSLYDTSREEFLEKDDTPGAATLEGIFIRCYMKDRDERFWIGTEQGLFLYDKSEGNILPFTMPETVAIRSVTSDNNRLWVGTERSGIYLYDFSQKSWSHMEASGNPGELTYGKVRSLYRDHSGLIWIGTRGGGVDLYNPATALIQTYSSRTTAPGTPKNSNIRQMIERRDGSIWIASDGGGISVLDRASGQFRFLDLDPRDSESDNDQVYTLMEDHKGNLWIGTDGSGLYFLEAGRGIEALERIPMRDLPGVEKYGGTVWAIFEDHENTLWIGMEGDGLFSLKEGIRQNYFHDPDNSTAALDRNMGRWIESFSERNWNL
ncbi:MAG: hypothetical protein B6241_09475 [Spirochaetaceae bacterium 4572_59]|nr:MAG: hypothetical protein B6241_09475 [Spirochaetaceae bacterium 4572_59]